MWDIPLSKITANYILVYTLPDCTPDYSNSQTDRHGSDTPILCRRHVYQDIDPNPILANLQDISQSQHLDLDRNRVQSVVLSWFYRNLPRNMRSTP
jgi:hypothetical protein